LIAGAVLALCVCAPVFAHAGAGGTTAGRGPADILLCLEAPRSDRARLDVVVIGDSVAITNEGRTNTGRIMSGNPRNL
jgi:hypothetical protein